MKYLIPLVILLLSGVGLFILWLYCYVTGDPQGVRFNEDPIILLYISGGFIVSGLIIFAWYISFLGKFTKVSLYENGLTVQNRRETYTCAYHDITDVYDFYDGTSGMSKGFSFHTDDKQKWWHINGQIADYYSLREIFTDKFIQQRGSMLLGRLNQGETIVFHKISGLSSRIKSKVMTLNFNMPMQDILLTNKDLTIEDTAYPINQMGEMKGNIWTNSMKITDQEGKTLYSTHITSILSAPLLHALLVALHEQSQTDSF